MNDYLELALPSYYDPEGGPVHVGNDQFYSFIIISNNQFIINPNKFDAVGVWNISVTLSDEYPQTSFYYFTLTVTNTAPYFLNSQPVD